MDWAASDHKPPPRRDPPAPHLIERYWRVVGVTGRIISCGVYRDEGPGVELRAGYSDDDILKTQRVASVEGARELAEKWRLAMLKMGLTEILE